METGVAHLLEGALKLDCSFEVTTRALFLYHHFMKMMGRYYFDEDLAAAGAIRLSGRINEQPVDLNTLLCVFYSITSGTLDVLSYDDVTYVELRQSLKHVGWIMFRSLYKDFYKPLAHQYLLPLLAMILERSKNIAEYRTELGSTCIRFLNDLYTRRLCLSYPPELIAVAVVDLSLYVHGLLNDLAMIPPWYMGFLSYIEPVMVNLLKQKIMAMYFQRFIAKPRSSLRYFVSDDGETIDVGEVHPCKQLEMEHAVQQMMGALHASEEVKALTTPKEIEELEEVEEVTIPEELQQSASEVQKVASTIEQVATEVEQIREHDDIYR